MTNEHKIAELEQWKTIVEQLSVECDKLTDILQVAPESPLLNAIWRMDDAYTNEVATRLGLGDWLSWYRYDNDMGRKAYNAGMKDNLRPIKTFEDLIWFAS